MIKVEPTVVDTVQTALEAVILTRNSGKETVFVAQWNVERVHTVVDVFRDELSEDCCRFAVHGRVAEVVLPRRAERGVDDEFAGLGIVGCCRCNARDIRSVPDFGHRESTGGFEVHDVGQPLIVVFLGAEVQHCRTKEAPLNARLDLQRRVSKHYLFEGGDISAVVVLTAKRRGERALNSAVVYEDRHLVEHTFAVVGHGEPVNLMKFGVCHECAGLFAGLRPLAQKVLAKPFNIDGGSFGVRGRGRIVAGWGG